VVKAGSETTISIDARLDQALHTNGWTGFAFASDADRDAHEGPFAAKIATSLGATEVAVVGIEQVRGRAAIVGSLVSLSSGREIRRASVSMDPDPSNDRLRALAKYLEGEEPASGIDVQPLDTTPIAGGNSAGNGPPIGHDEPSTKGGRWGGWKWITGAIGIGGLGTGAVLLAKNGSCSSTPRAGQLCRVYDTAAPGYGALAGGAVFAGLSIYLFATQGHEASKTAFIAPTGDGAIAGLAGSW
jgi:hypothetical protein